jgi:type II secretory pathway pseudopilin PulG
MNILNSLQRKKRNQDGFTIVELCIAMSVGIIVFAFAMSFLVSFALSAEQLKSKDDVTQESRIALTAVLKDLGSAANLPKCVQGSTAQVTQSEISEPNLVNNLDKCAEFVSTSQVLSVADGYTVCWYLSEASTTTSVAYPSKTACLFTGNSSTALCKGASQIDIDTIYYNECNTAGFSIVPNKARNVADLGIHKRAGVPARAPVQQPVFGFVNNDGSVFASGSLNKVLKVNVNVSMSYENGKYVNGDKDYSVYRFSQTIQLSGMKAFLEAGNYGI